LQLVGVVALVLGIYVRSASILLAAFMMIISFMVLSLWSGDYPPPVLVRKRNAFSPMSRSSAAFSISSRLDPVGSHSPRSNGRQDAEQVWRGPVEPSDTRIQKARCFGLKIRRVANNSASPPWASDS
jgi:hypothetical protein